MPCDCWVWNWVSRSCRTEDFGCAFGCWLWCSCQCLRQLYDTSDVRGRLPFVNDLWILGPSLWLIATSFQYHIGQPFPFDSFLLDSCRLGRDLLYPESNPGSDSKRKRRKRTLEKLEVGNFSGQSLVVAFSTCIARSAGDGNKMHPATEFFPVALRLFRDKMVT